MNWQDILQAVQTSLIIPLILLIGGVIVTMAKEKIADWKAARDNAKINKYLDLLASTIETCVTATNQTYVNELKEKNMFDAETQKIAFQKTYTAVITTLSAEAKKYLALVYDDLNTAISQQIESTVGINRIDSSQF